MPGHPAQSHSTQNDKIANEKMRRDVSESRRILERFIEAFAIGMNTQGTINGDIVSGELYERLEEAEADGQR